jgi:8-oxo-dGTP pyrophosphatase MutT (NUDIX family)
MFEFKTGAKIFHDHLGQPHEKPQGRPVIWRPSAYVLVRNCNHVLMVEAECTPGVLTLPGGGIEPDESIFDGLARECREELGVEVHVSQRRPVYLGEHDFYFEWTDEYMHSLILVFMGEVSRTSMDKLIVPPDQDEIVAVRWQALEELEQAACHFVVWPVIRVLKG